MSERLTLNVDEAAKKLGMSRQGTYAAVNRGELPAIRIGRRLLIPIAALDKYLSSPPQTARIGKVQVSASVSLPIYEALKKYAAENDWSLAREIELRLTGSLELTNEFGENYTIEADNHGPNHGPDVPDEKVKL